MKLHGSYISTISTPFFWWLKAIDLYQSAKVLLESYKEASDIYFGSMPKETGRVELTPEQQKASTHLRLPQVYLFLMGLAFENALKGILIGRNPDLVKNDKIRKKFFSGTEGHFLLKRFIEAEIQLSSEEKEFVDRLTDSVIWAGRYPTPTKENKWLPTALLNGGCIQPGTFLPDDESNAEKLWNKIHEVVQKDPNLPNYSQTK